MDFTQEKYLAPRTIEKMKILGAVLELPAKQHCQFSPFKVCSEIKETTFPVGHFTTISGHSIANYINIFHKTEVPTVILRCLMSLNLNWIKSYDINHKSIPESKLMIFYSSVVVFSVMQLVSLVAVQLLVSVAPSFGKATLLS